MDRGRHEAVAHSMMELAACNLKKDGYLLFAAILHMKDGRIVPVAFKGPSDDPRFDKEHLGQVLRNLSRECNLIAIVDEAWICFVPEEDVKDDSMPMPIREHPERSEAIFVSVQSPLGEFVLIHKFGRDRLGKPLVPTKELATWTEGRPAQPTNLQGLF